MTSRSALRALLLFTTISGLGCPNKEPARPAAPVEGAECMPPGLQCLGAQIAACAMTNGASGFGHYWKLSPCPGCSIAGDKPTCTSVTAGTFCLGQWDSTCGGPDNKTLFSCDASKKEWVAQPCPGGCRAGGGSSECTQ